MITRKQGSEPEPQQLYFFLIKAAGSSALPANRNQSRDAPCQHRRIPVWTQQIVSGPETTTVHCSSTGPSVVTARRAARPAAGGSTAAAAAARVARPVSTVLRSAAPWCLCGGVMGCL